MKIHKGDVMNTDAHLIAYLSNGETAKQLKREHSSIYNWVFPKRPLPLGSIIKTNASPTLGHAIFFAEDEYGGIKASDLYECFKEFKRLINDFGIDEQDVAISEELYEVIKKKDYIKE